MALDTHYLLHFVFTQAKSGLLIRERLIMASPGCPHQKWMGVSLCFSAVDQLIEVDRNPRWLGGGIQGEGFNRHLGFEKQ